MMNGDTDVRGSKGAHFGENLRQTKFGHKLTRELYAYPSRSPHQRVRREQVDEQLWDGVAWAYQDDEHTQHSDAYLLVQRDAALVNFDLSLQYFASLEGNEFEAALQHIIAVGETFESVQSLADWTGVEGAYVMVFDEYRQFYVGKANDIRQRIRKHWTSRKSFDRLIFGSKYDSIFPVDEFRALDTTRIYATRSAEPYAIEQRVEAAADRRFCLNRIWGGEASPLMLMLATSSPRERSHVLSSIDLSMAAYEQECDKVSAAIEQAKSSSDAHVGHRLAGMDLSFYSVTCENGRRFIWSRRDAIAGAAARGDLSVNDYAEFLTAIGETIVWPEESPRSEP